MWERLQQALCTCNHPEQKFTGKKFHLRAGGKNDENILQAKISGYMALLRHSLHKIAKPYTQVSSTVSPAALTALSLGQSNIPPF